MGNSWLTEDARAFARVPMLFLLALALSGALSSGCFVIRGERRIKPDSGPMIELRTGAGPVYGRVVDSPDFKMDIGVANGPARWELQFLFNISI